MAPCTAPRESVTADRDQVFVELALWEVPTARAVATERDHLLDLAHATDAISLSSPHVLATFDQPSNVQPGSRPEPPASVALSALSLLPRHAESGATVLELELLLVSRDGASRAHALSVSAREDEPGVARVDVAGARSVLVLFKYLSVRAEADLRRIFRCKMLLRQQALERR